jgi:hypothetical protein
VNDEIRTKLKQLSLQLEQEKNDAITKVLLEAGETEKDIENPEYLQANGYIRVQPAYGTGPSIIETFFWKGKELVRFMPITVTQVPMEGGGIHIEAGREIIFNGEEKPVGLLPCPSCGSPAQITEGFGDEGGPGDIWIVGCTQCPKHIRGARRPLLLDDDYTDQKEGLIEVWNTRQVGLVQ